MAVIGPLGFSNGLDTKSTIFNLPKNSLSTCQCLRPVNNSLVEKFGTGQLNSVALTGVSNKVVQGILPNALTPSSGGQYVVVAICDGKFYGITSSGVATDISGTASFLAGTNNQMNNCDFLNGIMVIADAQGSAGQLNQWSGTGNVTTLAGSPDGVSVRTVNNFVFTFEATTNPSRVWWSAVGDPTTWPAASFIEFRKKDGDSIQAIHYIGSDLYIFKKYSIGRLSTMTVSISGTVTLGPLQTIVVGIGAAGESAVDRLPDGRLIFIGSNSHVYLFDGNALTDVSDQPYPGPNVQSLFDALAPAYFGNFSRICVYPPRNEVWFIGSTNAPTTGNPEDRIMAYNYRDNNWCQLQTTSGTNNSIAWIPTINGASNGVTGGGSFNSLGNLLTGGNGDGFVYVQDVRNSITNVGAIQWNTSIPLSSEGRLFIPRSLLMFHKGTSATTSFTVTYAFDGGTLGNSNSVTTATTYTRTVIPLKLPTTGASSVGPSSLQIQVADSNGGGITFDPFYLSDEVFI